MPRKTTSATANKASQQPAQKKTEPSAVDLCQALFEQAEDGIFLCDRTGRCLDANVAGCRLLGYARRTLTGLMLTDILRPAEDTHRPLQLRGIQRGRTKTFQHCVRRKDGRDLPVYVRVQGLGNGRLLVIVKTRAVGPPASEQLRQSEQFLNSVLENLPDMVFVKDAVDLRFVRFNKSAEELLGYRREELLGKNDFDFFPKHEADFFTTKDREVLASGQLLDIAEEAIQTRAKGLRVLHTKKIPILDEKRQPLYLLGLSRDITEQYQLRLRETDRRRQLKRLLDLSLRMTGDPGEVFQQAVRIIGELFAVKVVCLSEIVGEALHFKAVYADGETFRDAGNCPLAIMPCATVETTRDVQVFDQVMERFPHASFLKDHQAFSYCGFPALDHGGRVVAVICLLDDKPHEFAEEDQDVMRLFGQRIAAEIDRARSLIERKGVEDRLRASEARLEFLLSATPAVIYSAKAIGDYDVTFMSDNVEEVLGYRPIDFLEQSGLWIKERHPDDREWVLAEMPCLFEQGFHMLEYRFRHKDGTYRWMRDEVRVVHDAEGQPVELVGCWSDVTARKQAELALRQSAARLQEAQQLARIGNWELDLLSNRLVCSDEIFRIFEINKMQFRASYEAFLNAVHPDDRAMVNEAYTTSVRERKPYEIVHRLLMADGRVKYVQERCETDFDQSGRPIRSHGTLQDVTERRLAELRIETSLREKETLLREVHHRVKNNLQIISSLLYFQSKKIHDVEGLAVFREGQDRLKSMILVHEKLYRSENLARIDFDDYVRALADGVRQSYTPIRAKVDLVIDVPPMVLPLEIAMPTGMILNELLTNTFKYAFPGDHGGVVRICVIPAEEAIEILVEDTGVGFPEGIDPERPATFGLQLIHGLMSQLGGRIVFSRERGQGTSVRVQVPIPVPAGP